MGVRVDEAGGDDAAGGVDHPGRVDVAEAAADAGDAAAGDADVAAVARQAGAVDDGAVADDEVEHGNSWGGDGTQRMVDSSAQRRPGRSSSDGHGAAREQLGEGVLVEADRGRGAVGVAQRDDELGPAVVAGPDRRRLDHGSAVRSLMPGAAGSV